MPKVLQIAYFPPISYFSLLSEGDVLLEAHENYQKQSWRNRCLIPTANGPEALHVPVQHSGGSISHPIRSVLVDYSRPWMERHKRAIDSAYRSSAWFEYYRDELYALMDLKPDSLWDLDYSILEFFLKKLHLGMPGLTGQYTGAALDLSPKRPDTFYVEKPYFQVFSARHGFLPNMSIMDLLFNEGPSAADFL